MVLPQSAKAGRAIAQDWNRNARETLERAFPQGAADLASFRARFGEALALVLNVEKPPTGSLVRKAQAEQKHGDWVLARESVGRKGHGDAVDIELWRKERQPSGAIVLVLPESFGLLGGADVPPWIRTLSDSGNAVFRVRGYASGRLRIPDQTWDSLSWPDSYNRSNGLLAIQDIVTAIAAARERLPGVGITVAGFGKAGLLAAFAAAIDGGAARLIADLDGENPDYDGTLLKLLPVGSIRRVGDLRTAMLLVPGRVHLLNPGPGFDGGWYQKRTGGRVTIHEGLAATDPAIARLMAGE
jgi:hypothetical protein